MSVALISIGPSREDRDEFTSESLGLAVTINPPPPPVNRARSDRLHRRRRER